MSEPDFPELAFRAIFHAAGVELKPFQMELLKRVFIQRARRVNSAPTIHKTRVSPMKSREMMEDYMKRVDSVMVNDEMRTDWEVIGDKIVIDEVPSKGSEVVITVDVPGEGLVIDTIREAARKLDDNRTHFQPPIYDSVHMPRLHTPGVPYYPKVDIRNALKFRRP